MHPDTGMFCLGREECLIVQTMISPAHTDEVQATVLLTAYY